MSRKENPHLPPLTAAPGGQLVQNQPATQLDLRLLDPQFPLSGDLNGINIEAYIRYLQTFQGQPQQQRYTARSTSKRRGRNPNTPFVAERARLMEENSELCLQHNELCSRLSSSYGVRVAPAILTIEEPLTMEFFSRRKKGVAADIKTLEEENRRLRSVCEQLKATQLPQLVHVRFFQLEPPHESMSSSVTPKP